MKSSSHASRPPIAVVGVSALFPGSLDATGFWKDILEGTDRITDVPPSHWLIDDYYDPDPSVPDKTYARRGAFLGDVDFDALAWGVPPSIVPETDTSQLLALIVAQRVLEDASAGAPDKLDRSRISVILGVTSGQELLGDMVSRLQRPVWVKSLRESGMPEAEVQAVCDRIASHYTPWNESNFPGLLGNVVAGRIANRLDLGGTNCVTDAACASTFSALSMGIHELELGESDLVITGGVDTMNSIFMFMCFSKTPALSLTGDCRPFSDKADGTMLGEGIGMVALKRLADAERDGDTIYALIDGVGTSSDGRAKSVYAPRPEGQGVCLRRAYDAAGYGAETVELIEAHGTGTPAGDAAEFEGLRTVFDETGRADRQWCAIGSVKSQIGHTKAAAGAAGLFKAVMALHHKVLPPTIKIERPNPSLRLDASPFHVSTTARPWVRASDHPRRAGVSAFGFGGSNFHVVLSEYEAPASGTGCATQSVPDSAVGATARPADRLRALPGELVVLCGDDAAGLAAEVRRLAGDSGRAGFLAWLAYSSQQSFRADAQVRLALVATGDADLQGKLRQAADAIDAAPHKAWSTPTGIHYGAATVAGRGDMAFLFAGQGSQALHMGASLAMHFPAALRSWDAAADLAWDGAASLASVVFPPTAFSDDEHAAQTRRLAATEWAQPAIGCTSLSMLALLDGLGLRADAVGGHSFGEVTALHAAGVLSQADFLAVARRRGELMRDAAGIPGAMLAVALPIETIDELLASWGHAVVVANHNGPSQVVLSGPAAEIEHVAARCKAEGITSRRLEVATAFHSPAMESAGRAFAGYLDGVAFHAPAVPVYSNTTGSPHAAGACEIRDALARQITSPVRFVDMVESMYESGVRTFVEVGPGSVQTGLVASILGERPHLAVSLDRKGKDGIHGLLHALAALAASGRALEFDALWDGYAVPADPRERQKPRFSVPINGANYGKPYPPAGGTASLPKPNPPRVQPAVPAAPAPSPAWSAATVPSPAAFATSPAGSATSPAPSVPSPTGSATSPAAPASPALPAASVPSPAAFATSPAVSATSPAAPAWSQARADAQMQVAQVHGVYLQTMAETHTAFLDMIARSLAPAAAASLPQAPSAMPSPAVVSPNGSPLVSSNGNGHVRNHAITAPAAPSPLATPHAPLPNTPAATLVTHTPSAAATTVAAAVDLHALMLEVVSEKTGYPAEMLTMEMELEGDLGIDSIKRVEILSRMTDRVPGLPEFETAVLARLQTLGEVVAYMNEALGSAVGASPAASTRASGHAASANAATASPMPAAAVDLHKLMLEVVSEKTGYPAEMLTMEMELEGDLGIDSIKRVEILSRMTDRVPGLPEFETAVLAKLQTLGEVVAYMNEALGSAVGASPAATSTTRTSGHAVNANAATTHPMPTPTVDLHALMLEVVAEKTGYPPEMLTMEMELEGDLGIDSIKRVEILSRMTDRVPGLPEFETAVLAKLQTLGQVVEYMNGKLGLAGAAPLPVATVETAIATPAAGTKPAAAAQLGRYVLETVDTPALGMAQSGLFGSGPVVVTGDGTGLRERLVAALARRGIQAVGDDQIAEDAARAARGVVFLGGLRAAASVDDALAVNREAFAAARRVASSMEAAKAGDAIFVTVQDTGGTFATGPFEPVRAWLSGCAALARTLRQEWPGVSVKAIDLERAGRSCDELAEAIADELACGGPDLDVGLPADGRRLTLRSRAVEVTPASSPLADGDVVVASGGARGVTAATLVELARQASLRFVLLGRTRLQEDPPCCLGVHGDAALKRALLADASSNGDKPTPAMLGAKVAGICAAREIRETLSQIEAAGSQARYLAVDVSDAAALASALETVRAEWGPVAAVVHGAGVIADKRVVEKTAEQFDRVFDTKVQGLRALLDATAADPLKLLCLFSSVAARCGNTGQCDYAMANEILNKVAVAEARRRAGACVVKSLGWGPWEGGMVSPQLRSHFEAMGVPLIPLAAGAAMLVDEIAGFARGEVELVLGGAPGTEALIGAREERRLRVEVMVGRDSHPYLSDHAIRGVPVVPVALVVEWFARTARAFAGADLVLTSMRNLEVVRGISLPRFAEAPERLVLGCRHAAAGNGHATGNAIANGNGNGNGNAIANGNGNGNGKANGSASATANGSRPANPGAMSLLLELTDVAGRVHYRGVAEMAHERGTTDAAAEHHERRRRDVVFEQWQATDVYDGEVLFHGPDFQMIQSIDGISDHGILAGLSGVLDSTHSDAEPWCTDPLIFDGGLQLALLWCQRVLGGASLPTSIAEIRTWSDDPLPGPFRCTLTGRSASGRKSVSDVLIHDESGRIVALLTGIETHLLPAQAAAAAQPAS